MNDVVLTLIFGLLFALFHLYERDRLGLISQGLIAAQFYSEGPVFLTFVEPNFL